MAFNIGNVFVRIKAVTEDFDAGLKRMQSGIDDFKKNHDGLQRVGEGLKSVGEKLSLAFTTTAGVVGGLSVRAFSDLNEAINANQVIFGEGSKKMLAFAETAATSVGLSKRAFLEAATPIGAAFRNVGFGAEEAADKSILLTKRAADMASVFNTSLDDALQAIQAGLRGEADPLERFGVGLNETAVQAYAVRNGLVEQGKAMDTSTQMTARLGLLMEQTNRVQGDFSNTSDGLANRQRILKARLEDTAASLGEKLAPYVTKLLEKVQGLVDWFGNLSDGQQKVILVVGGLLAVLGPFLVMLGALAQAFVSLGAAMTLFNIGLGPLLLIIAGITALIALAVLVVANWDTVKSWFSAFWQFMQGLWDALTAKVVSAWQSMLAIGTAVWNAIWNVIQPIVNLIIGILTTYFNIYKYIFEMSLAIAIAVWNAIWNAVKPVVDAIASAVSWLGGVISSIFNAVANTAHSVGGAIGSAFSAAWNAVVGVWNGAVGWFQGVWNKIADAARGIAGAISGAIGGAFSSVAGVVKGAINGAIDLVNGAINKINSVASKVHGPQIPNIPRLFKGVQGFMGGFALVGEQGPELVNLNRGADVYTANETRQMMAGAGNGSPNIHIEVNGPITSPHVARQYAVQIGDQIIEQLKLNTRL